MKYLNIELVNNDKVIVIELLKKNGFRQIGHFKDKCVGLCLNLEKKTFFELSAFRNPNIELTADLGIVLNIA